MFLHVCCLVCRTCAVLLPTCTLSVELNWTEIKVSWGSKEVLWNKLFVNNTLVDLYCPYLPTTGFWAWLCNGQTYLMTCKQWLLRWTWLMLLAKCCSQSQRRHATCRTNWSSRTHCWEIEAFMVTQWRLFLNVVTLHSRQLLLTWQVNAAQREQEEHVFVVFCKRLSNVCPCSFFFFFFIETTQVHLSGLSFHFCQCSRAKKSHGH